jgi:phosphoribosylanthranilate isomerase
MTWVKICGITNAEDAETAVDAGADAIGFVFYDRSPRNVDIDRVREITQHLPPSLEAVGVFVDTSASVMIDIARAAGLKGIQLHSTHVLQPQLADTQEPKEGLKAYCAEGLNMYFVLPAQGFTWESSGFRAPFGIFLDSGTPDQPGGTGKTFDWKQAASLVAEMSKDVNVVVAGGLNPENVAAAIEVLHPWGVDVSSGVEASPGKKDPEKVRAFMRAVREADKNL